MNRLWIVLLIMVLTGCMYPEERKVENKLPPLQQVQMVQGAIDQFFAETKILPISTKEANTPVSVSYTHLTLPTKA